MVLARREGPGQRLGAVEVEGHAQFRVEAAVDGDFVGVGHRVVDDLLPHQVEQFLAVELAVLLEGQLGVFLLQGAQAFGVAAAGHHFQAAVQVVEVLRRRRAVAVHQLRGDLLIHRAEEELAAALVGDRQAGRRQVGLAGRHLLQDLGQAVGYQQLQVDTEVLGEAGRQVVFQAGRPLRPLIIGGGAVARQHPQLAAVLHAVQVRLVQVAGGEGAGQQQQGKAHIRP